jgi:hypothetical protein
MQYYHIKPALVFVVLVHPKKAVLAPEKHSQLFPQWVGLVSFSLLILSLSVVNTECFELD